jgi:hypothetical protein
MVEPTRRDGAATSGGLLLIALGIFFLLGQFFGWSRWDFAWPFFIIVPGLLFFLAAFMGGRSSAGLAIPGSIITTIGLILLYQDVFDHFESWAYAWALIPTAVGVGIVIDGRWRNDPVRVQHGGRLATIGLTLFAVGFVFFEMLLNIGGVIGGALSRTIVPILLIGAGIYLFIRTPRRPVFGQPTSTTTIEGEVVEQEEAGPSITA